MCGHGQGMAVDQVAARDDALISSPDSVGAVSSLEPQGTIILDASQRKATGCLAELGEAREQAVDSVRRLPHD